MTTLKFDQAQLDALQVAEGLGFLCEDYNFRLGDGICVTLQDTQNDDLSVTFNGKSAVLSFDFKRRVLFFRALSHVLQAISEGKTEISVKETAVFDSVGPMLDLSQGDMCLNMKTMQSLLRKQAMMGLNLCQLYMEDNFEVPEEPYFGQMRPRYTYEELKAIDDYAYALGIEVFPHIEVLGHQSTVMVWDVYLPIRENNRTLLPGEPKTYEYLRHVLTAATKPFRSKRVFVAMDEAAHLGHGAHFLRHGLVDPTTILLNHAERVLALCKELGLRPMVWEDPFFRALFKNENTTPEQMEQCRQIGSHADLVCYCYNNGSVEYFENRIERRSFAGKPSAICPTIWSWLGFGPNWLKTLSNANFVAAARNKGVRENIISIWEIGYDCDWRVNHFGLQLYAELSYKVNPTEDDFRRRFKFCCGGDYDDFMLLHEFDCVPTVPERNNIPHPSAATEFLLWQDPLCGLFDKDIEGLNIGAHFEKLEHQMAEAVKRAEGTEYADALEHYRRLAAALALKSDLGVNIRKAYLAGDREELTRLAKEVIPDVICRVQALRVHHRKCWRQCGKALGWEIYDLHYGGTLSRLDSAAMLMQGYLDGEIEDLDEVSAPRLPYLRGGFGHAGKIPAWTDKWGRMVSASMVCPEWWLNLSKGENAEDVG